METLKNTVGHTIPKTKKKGREERRKREVRGKGRKQARKKEKGKKGRNKDFHLKLKILEF